MLKLINFILLINNQLITQKSTKYEDEIIIEITIVISEVIFGAKTESGLRIAPSRQVFE